MGERFPLLLAIVSAIFASSAHAADSGDARPVVVELFSSQACSSCVSASEFLTELAERADVVALSFHVDYWNTLQTSRGRWVDPYSNENCTKRQKTYNKNIRRRSTVYTPQMIVNGAAQAVGSKRERVDRLIAKARDEAAAASVAASREGDQLAFSVVGVAGEAEAHLVTFKRRIKTEVKGGENAGVMYKDAHVVTKMELLGAVSGANATFEASAPGEGDHCALIVQEPDQGRILTASYCAEI